MSTIGQTGLFLFMENTITEGPSAAWTYATAGKNDVTQKAGAVNQLYNQFVAGAVALEGASKTFKLFLLPGTYETGLCALQYPVDILLHLKQGESSERSSKTALIALAILNGARMAQILYCLETCDSQIPALFDIIDLANHTYNLMTLASYAAFQANAPKIKKLV